jgi:GntR family transcriptional regulator/MocR family aminotransferase
MVSKNTPLPIVLDGTKKEPLYQQIITTMREAILQGRLPEGEAVLSTRELAKRLGVSRKTVIRSYEVLLAQGFLSVNQDKVTVVTVPNETTLVPAAPAEDLFCFEQNLSNYAKQIMELGCSEFDAEVPPAEHVPFDAWRRYLLSHLNRSNILLRPERDPLGYKPLRAAISHYLGRVHSVTCTAEQIAILPGGVPTLDLIARLFVNAGDNVVVEEPGSRSAKRVFLTYGAQLIPIAIDENGLRVELLDAIIETVKLVYVTPSHHNPTGAVLSASRRQALIEWANRKGALIIESHYDSEYNYTTRPLPALQALSKTNSVIYFSTFWKLLGPILRLGFVVVPEPMIPLIKSARYSDIDALPLLDQCALADFISEGHLERHIRRTEKVYAQRRRILVTELIGKLGRRVRLAKESAGLQQYIKLNLNMTNEKVLECAKIADLPLLSLAPWYLDKTNEGEFLIPFVDMSEEHLKTSINYFAELVKG